METLRVIHIQRRGKEVFQLDQEAGGRTLVLLTVKFILLLLLLVGQANNALRRSSLGCLFELKSHPSSFKVILFPSSTSFGRMIAWTMTGWRNKPSSSVTGPQLCTPPERRGTPVHLKGIWGNKCQQMNAAINRFQLHYGGRSYRGELFINLVLKRPVDFFPGNRENVWRNIQSLEINSQMREICNLLTLLQPPFLLNDKRKSPEKISIDSLSWLFNYNMPVVPPEVTPI